MHLRYILKVYFSNLIFSLLPELIQSSLDTVVVTLEGGAVRGLVNTTTQSRFVSFLGIPYAVPPLKDLRFRAPVPFPSWSFTINATRYQRECLRGNYLDYTKMSEDCLYLNVFIPGENNLINNSNPRPVIVYLNDWNSANDDRRAVSQSAERNDVIAVSLNSRRDVFGFLSLGKTVPGNFGLLDQNLALKWVEKNIKHFGGDPNNIVIFGERNVISLHIASPLSYGLFKGAVAHDSSFSRNPVFVGYSNLYLKSNYLNRICDLKSGPSSIELCLRRAGVADILNITMETKLPWQHSFFHPVIDRVFLKEFPVETVSSGKQNPVDYMVLASQDRKIFTNDFRHYICDMDMFSGAIDFVISQLNISGMSLIKETLRTIYYPEQNTNPKICSQIWKLLEDFSKLNLLAEIDEHSRAGLTFLLLGTPSLNGTTRTMGTTDGDGLDTDIWCIFYDQMSDKCRYRRDEFRNLEEMIFGFIKHSYPVSSDGTIWRPYTKSRKNYLQYRGGDVTPGDINTWPYHRLERFWRIYLPTLSGNISDMRQNSKHIIAKSHFELNWGLNQHQVEALVFSLVLISLFLLCINIALFRIICHVKGKPFQNKKKEKTTAQMSPENAQSEMCNGHVIRGRSSIGDLDIGATDSDITESIGTSRL